MCGCTIMKINAFEYANTHVALPGKHGRAVQYFSKGGGYGSVMGQLISVGV